MERKEEKTEIDNKEVNRAKNRSESNERLKSPDVQYKEATQIFKKSAYNQIEMRFSQKKNSLKYKSKNVDAALKLSLLDLL